MGQVPYLRKTKNPHDIFINLNGSIGMAVRSKKPEDAIFRLRETKKDDLIMAATNLFRNIINIHLFEDENGRIYRLILAYVLIQMKCFLFAVILISFHRRGRRHYIRAVKMFDRKPSMLSTMIVKSLIHCWDNFEQNAKMILPGSET